MVNAALARYASSTGAEVDVLRAQLETARLEGERRALVAEIRTSEVMFNASLARPVDAPISELDGEVTDVSPPPTTQLARAALDNRPELRADRAEIARSEAGSVRRRETVWRGMRARGTGTGSKADRSTAFARLQVD